MTPEREAEIRASTPCDQTRDLLAELDRLRAELERACEELTQWREHELMPPEYFVAEKLRADKAKLLTELDRLRAEVERLKAHCECHPDGGSCRFCRQRYLDAQRAQPGAVPECVKRWREKYKPGWMPWGSRESGDGASLDWDAAKCLEWLATAQPGAVVVADAGDVKALTGMQNVDGWHPAFYRATILDRAELVVPLRAAVAYVVEMGPCDNVDIELGNDSYCHDGECCAYCELARKLDAMPPALRDLLEKP